MPWSELPRGLFTLLLLLLLLLTVLMGMLHD